MVETSNLEIDSQAAKWAVKVDAGSLNPEDQAGLSAWLDQDVRHLGAYAKARAVLAYCDRARALGPGFDPASFETADAAGGRLAVQRRFVLLGGVAASIAAFGITGAAIWRFFGSRAYATSVGQTRVVPLEDGSIVTLNTNSRITVNYANDRRDIKLERGEALFDVAKDKPRPFTVAAGGTTVQALGTSFTVQTLPDRPVQVLVREGVVEVKRPQVPVAPPVRLKANDMATVPADAPIQTRIVAPIEVARALSWRLGRLSFEGETLSAAAETFARYSNIRIEIDDPAVARRTVTGLFVSNDPVGFSKAAALSLGLRAEVNDGLVKLSR